MLTVTLPEVKIVYLTPKITFRGEPIYKTYPTIGDVFEVVAKFYEVSLVDMRSQRQTQDIIMRSRHVAMYLARTMTLRPQATIGKMMGDRDPTACRYAVRKIAAQMETDERLRDEVELCRMKIDELISA